MRINIPPVVRLSLGLVFLTTSILFIAEAIGLIPDVRTEKLEARKKYTEALAIQTARTAESGQIGGIKKIFSQIAQRNDDVQSISIRMSNGTPLILIGEHQKYWTLKPGVPSTSSQMQVPIYSHNKPWGNFEIRYRPLSSIKYIHAEHYNSFILSLFVGLTGFIVYFFFLKRSLKALDPLAVIPSRVRSAMDSLSEGVLILDNNGFIVLANKALGDRLGITPDQLLGKNPSRFNWELSENKKNTRLPWERSLQHKAVITDTPITLRTKNAAYSFMVSTSPIVNEDHTLKGVLVTFNDVTQLTKKNNQLQNVIHTLKKSQVEVRQKNRALKLLASLDPLTGCMNRRSFFEVADKTYAESKLRDQPIYSIMIDIDHFKAVNDTYGHAIGDQVIRSVAETIKDNLREGDWVCRYGGEEFCVFLQDTRIEHAGILAERIRAHIGKLDFSDNPTTIRLHVTVSLGLAESTEEISSLNELIDLADQALYSAKENGRNKVVTWDKSLRKPVETNLDINKSRMTDPHGGSDTSGASTPHGRKQFSDRIKAAISSIKGNTEFYVAIFDIDFFRRINNSLGHQAGDQVLGIIEDRLQQLFSNAEFLNQYPDIDMCNCAFHLSGDDFGLLIQPNDRSIDPVEIFSRIVEWLSRTFVVNFQNINITYSLGISTYPADGKAADVLLQNAEIAMYHAKEKGGNLIELFKKEINAASLEKLQLEAALHNAIENNELSLVYQPKINLVNQQITGLEALLRWNHPTLGHIPPDQFIPIAERTGLIVELGYWVLRTACAQAKQWLDKQIFDTHIAVNLSALQLKKPDFVARTFRILNDTNLPPQYLELEVTENILMENLEMVTSALHRLNNLNVQIAIDDFGTGYSSLSYLKRFPINTLKIDRCFIEDITDDPDDEAIISAIIAMAHALKLNVVAEGVETQAQLEKLQQLHCDQMQGYLFSRPLRAEEIEKLLEENYQLTVNTIRSTAQIDRKRQLSTG